MRTPEWTVLGSQLGPPVLTFAAREMEGRKSSHSDPSMISRLSITHFQACLNSSIMANREYQPSVAMCLLRQCVEALTVIDAALQQPPLRDDLLVRWYQGKLSQGELRRDLETSVWFRYGHGLWDESWGQYFANIARAVQPYAHFTPELMNWQLVVVSTHGKGKFTVGTGQGFKDQVKASRLSLVQALVVWTLGRLLLANSDDPDVLVLASDIRRLGTKIGESKLLFKNKESAHELLPHVYFEPGIDWRDQ